MTKPLVWTIAGIDSSAGAGITADVMTLHHLNAHAAAITTAVTAQNSRTISDIATIPTETISAQIAALLHDGEPHAIKIGMLGASVADIKLRKFLQDYSGYVVLDPVMVTSTGASLFHLERSDYLAQLKQWLPLADILTPNIAEAEQLVGYAITSYTDMKKAAHAILNMGAKSVLLKGGHIADPTLSQDYWLNQEEAWWIANPRHPVQNYRGTGCTLSSAIAASLALGYSYQDAIVIAKMYVNRGIRCAETYLPNTAKLWHKGWPEEEIDLPYIASQPLPQLPLQISSPALTQIGLYPIVDSAAWLNILLPLGIKTIQLRIKNAHANVEQEIVDSIALARRYNAQLFINDYWELAISHGAFGVHLGQSDLNTADITAIKNAGLHLGISTHCYYEVARAHALRPSYIAFGPIYPTTSKVMPFQAQGTTPLTYWQRTLNYPVVAIGGINLEKLPAILATGVSGVALISAITHASDPIAATQQLLAAMTQGDVC